MGPYERSRTRPGVLQKWRRRGYLPALSVSNQQPAHVRVGDVSSRVDSRPGHAYSLQQLAGSALDITR